MNQVILSLFLTSLPFFLYFPFFAYAETEIDPSDPVSKYQDIIIAVFSVIVGSIVATLLVQYWNNKKEINEKRRTVLNNYFNEVIKPVSLMDNFVDKLLIYLSSLDKTDGVINGKKLSDYLAWTYTFQDLEDFKDILLPFKTYPGVIQEEEINYTKNDISNFFKELQDENDNWIINTDNLTSEQKDEIKKRFYQFENEFHDIQIKSVEFFISLRQYYTDKTLKVKYHAIFEYMIGSFFIIRKITDYLDDKKKILDLILSYNKNSNFLHAMMMDFESKLIDGDIQIK